MKATQRPSAEMEGSKLSSLPGSPRGVTLTRSSRAGLSSRTHTSRCGPGPLRTQARAWFACAGLRLSRSDAPLPG